MWGPVSGMCRRSTLLRCAPASERASVWGSGVSTRPHRRFGDVRSGELASHRPTGCAVLLSRNFCAAASARRGPGSERVVRLVRPPPPSSPNSTFRKFAIPLSEKCRTSHFYFLYANFDAFLRMKTGGETCASGVEQGKTGNRANSQRLFFGVVESTTPCTYRLRHAALKAEELIEKY